MDKRKHLRFKTRFDVLYANEQSEGAGVLTNLSYSGACLEEASHVPEVGSAVRLYIFVQPVAPFELIGRVVRRGETGFAVSCEVDDAEVRRLVDDVSAIVNAS